MSHFVISPELHKRILAYYVDAGVDYAFWSKDFNMHFGYGGFSTLFKREEMLHKMTEEVITRLAVKEHHKSIVDFGCGVGGSMRRAHRMHPHLSVTGLTIVPWQKEKGDLLNGVLADKSRLDIRIEDYHNSMLEDESADGIYAIESACYSPREHQSRFFNEAFRVLKEGRRFVIADGFLKVEESALCPTVRHIYKGICKNWALPGMLNMSDTKAQLTKAGFKRIHVEDVSWKVAPSVVHVPFVIAKFLLHKYRRNEPLSRQSVNNLKGSFQTLLLGIQRQYFGYYLITAEK
jgi:MPBQ/MSBQ methyltransferase